MCQNCKCCHLPDHGACRTYERGMNGRCVYCDHAKGCHPGKGPLANGPLEPITVTRHVEPDTSQETLDALNQLAVAAAAMLSEPTP